MPFVLLIVILALAFLVMALGAWTLAWVVPALILDPGNIWAWFCALLVAYSLLIVTNGAKK